MALWNPNSAGGPRSLAELELSVDIVHRCLFAAVTDAQLCTAFDSPTAFGSTMWTRSNRYLREELVPIKWTYTNSKLILRTIHPSGAFAITAVSAQGHVGDVTGSVRTRNPKGEAVARIIAANGTMPFVFGDATIDTLGDETSDDIPTFFLLYKKTLDAVLSEVAFPVEMTGAYVDKWTTRLPVPPLEVGGIAHDWDDNSSGPDFPVEEL